MTEINEDFIEEWLRHRISFSKQLFSNIWKKEYNEIVEQWINEKSNKILFIYLNTQREEDQKQIQNEKDNEKEKEKEYEKEKEKNKEKEQKLKFAFNFSSELLNETIKEYIIFLKISNSEKITTENIDDIILYNKINNDMKENILTLMDRIFIPSMNIKNVFSTNIQNELKIATMDVMSYLNQLFSKNKFLYYPKIPVEQITVLSSDKSYIALLEKLLQHWICDLSNLLGNVRIYAK